MIVLYGDKYYTSPKSISTVIKKRSKRTLNGLGQQGTCMDNLKILTIAALCELETALFNVKSS